MTSHPDFVGEEASVAQDLRARSPAPVRRVVAMTRDGALVRALEELAATGFDICVVEDAESLCDELLQSHSSTALVDAAATSAPVEGFVDALATQFPDLRLLVAGQSAEQNLLATRIASGRVLRFVHKPASAQRLKLMIDASSRTADAHRITVTQTLEVLQEPKAVPAARPQPPFRDTPRSRTPLIAIAAAVAAALLAWALWPADEGTSPLATPDASAVSSDPASPAGELVRRADQAFAAGRYVAADGSSSAELYRDALKLNPDHARARSGFDRSVEFGLQGAEASLLAERIDEAAGAAETLRLLVPGNSRLAFLQSQIEKERSRLNASASQRAAVEARQQQIQGHLEQMQDRLDRGALIEPARDNAVTHFRSAEALAAGDPAVRAARDALVGALLDAADAGLQAQRTDEARGLIEAAATINSGAAGIDALRLRLEQQAIATAVAAAPASTAPAARVAGATSMVAPNIAAATVPAPAQMAAAPPSVAPAPAPAAAPPSDAPVSASELRRINYVAPEYPPRALDQLLSGWVDLEFTVNAQGRVQDIVVLDAEPGNVFNSAAIAAARRWRYDPVVRNGEPVSLRARQRVRFTAQEQGASR